MSKINKVLVNNTVLEKSNERLVEENDSLKQENMVLRSFKDKVVNFFRKVIDKIPTINNFIENEVPEIKNKVNEREIIGAKF